MVELSDRERQALTLLSARAASREVGRALHLGGVSIGGLPQARRAKPDRGAARRQGSHRMICPCEL